MSDQNKDEFVIAALGASAGGLEAFERFFKNMPPSAGMLAGIDTPGIKAQARTPPGKMGKGVRVR